MTGHAPPTAAKYRPHLSTAETLTLVTVSVVVAVLAVAMIVIWLSLRDSAVETEQERVSRSVRQLINVSVTGVRLSQPRYSAAAHDSSVLRAIAGSAERPDAATAKAARAALIKLQLPTDSGLPVEAWSADGRRVVFVGDDVIEKIGLRPNAEAGTLPVAPMREGLDDITTRDSVQIGRLYRMGDRTMFWIAMPIVVNGAVRGYIVQQRRIAANPQTEQTIRELGGNSVAGYYHNVDGSAWTTFGGTPVDPPTALPSGERVRSGERMIYEETRIPGTPLVLGMEAPRSTVVARPAATVRRLVILSAFLTILGAVIAWSIGHRVARPLVRLTDAAESVARGDYSARVPTKGSEEVALLATAFNRMAEQIAETSAGLEEARAAAETGSRAKSEFLAAMSHELRTPLNAIGGYAELIEMGLRGPITDEQRRDLARIRASQQHLLGLIGSILDLSRIESGRVAYNLVGIAVEPFLASLDALVLPQATAKQQTFSIEPPAPMLTVLADREKLRQIMINLLSNAIRHSQPGASITVAADQRTPETIGITVRDTGPGIPSDRYDSIFEPFVQLDQSFRARSEGIGLGLAISRDLARGMGGELTVASVLGEGACFILTLPAGVFDEQTQIAGTSETPVHGIPMTLRRRTSLS